MSQITTKWIANLAVISGATGTGKIGSGAAAATSALFSDGSGGTAFRAIAATDLPGTITSNTSGTASNITATSNSTLTTLSALTTAGSLAISGSQVSGGTFGVVNGSALTNLSAANLSGVLPVGVTGGSGLSIATSQLTGDIALASQVSGILPVANGGTGDSSFTADQVVIGGTTSTGPLAQVAAGTSGQVLTSNGSSAPTWATAASGSVTSVALADGSTTPIYSISDSPVTSSGTLTLTLDTQSANSVFAGPSSGSAAEPTFRSLVSADIPDLSATYVTQSEVGAANGVVPLNASSKIAATYLPSNLMEYEGSWNPNTNTPALADGTGTTGEVYRVSALDLGTVAGLSDPSMTNFQVGNLVIYNGSVWQQAPSADGVTFVNGAQGAIVSTVASANGFAGSYSANILSISTSITGILQGNGTAISAASTTGSGAVVLATSPTLVTPALGTPSAIVLTNASGVLPVGVTGGSGLSIATSQLTGDIALASQVSGILPIANGGTGQSSANAAFDALSPMTTAGDIIYENATPTAARLAIGSTGQVLTVVGGIPAWSNTAATMTPGKDTFVLSSTDITNQYVTLTHTPIANSTDLLIVGAGDQLEGASYDYTVSGATIVFENGLATGGVSALVAERRSSDFLSILTHDIDRGT